MDDNVVRMMPKGREQVLRSAQGVGFVRSAYSDQIITTTHKAKMTKNRSHDHFHIPLIMPNYPLMTPNDLQ